MDSTILMIALLAGGGLLLLVALRPPAQTKPNLTDAAATLASIYKAW